MLKIQTFTFNAFGENTYILHNENGSAWIVDPGMSSRSEEAEVEHFLTMSGLTLKAIFNTHAHIDHILGVDWTVNKYKVPFHLHLAEGPVLRGAAASAAMFGLSFREVVAKPVELTDGQRLLLDEEEIIVMATPGHSAGSVSFYCPTGGWVIGGDVLFRGGIGRTDLPGGHYATLIQSIKEVLLKLPLDTVVYSGHGGTTTVALEKSSNPFL